VAGAADVEAVLLLERDAARPGAAGGARLKHEQVSDQASERVFGRARDGGRDEAVGRVLQQRDLLAGGGAQGLGVQVAPVLVDQ
jgi:hypothetical protein